MKDLLTCASGLLPVDRPDRIHGDAAEWQLFQNSPGHFAPGGPASLWCTRALCGAHQGISRFSRIVAVT